MNKNKKYITIEGRKYLPIPNKKDEVAKAIAKYKFYNPNRPAFKEKDSINLIKPRKAKPYIDLQFDKLQIGLHLIVRGQDIPIEIVDKLSANEYIAFDKNQKVYPISPKNSHLYRHTRSITPPRRMFIDFEPVRNDQYIECPCYPPIPKKKEPIKKIPKSKQKLMTLQIKLELVQLELEDTKGNAARVLKKLEITNIQKQINQLIN